MSSGKADGGQLEERIDLSSETESKISQAQTLISSSPTNLSSALSLLASIEKRARVGNDTPSLVKICEASLQLCKDCNDEESLIDTIKMLTSRRSQKSKAIGACVNKAIPWVLDCGDESSSGDGMKGYVPLAVTNNEQKEIRERLVVTLRDITDGKLFLEAERARLTRALSIIKEQDGDIAGAADTLQDVHVETYGSLSKREKIEFILEQMRLTIGKKDYVRAHIVGNKINRKNLSEEGMEKEKIKFFMLMSEYHRHEKDAFELSKDYFSIYSTSTIQKDETEWKKALQNTVLFLALSPYSIEQQGMLHSIKLDSNLEKIEACQKTINLLLTKEIIPYPMPHQEELQSYDGFITCGEGEEDLIFHWKQTFRARIIQHNVRVAALYYRRIRGGRLAQLLGLTSNELEKEVAAMVSNGDVYAKIDRPNDIIRFKQERNPETVLSDWASDISTLLHLVETTSHLIQKENMTR
mmetsp:Transcript_9037/g.11324  ORF Transcript_9037/g.11324 Transcript_9037/m.11324 type:complete len:469 (+) Transcript_9037:17-1423(+)|eukprot:CAMPEP_0203674490 /NCGR_PEP_ID=MMETSP0090-20130426/16413_1 /ASSEMBLY_ACC=CAM_ASM_001088 /TAXON_ID=426623 /ORGANISM="Chaetoceros affinis, Strain CCMP159" /LENGTH=468 /DNA_ID=CAMNT_0050540383 /DNA_START=26 /DNA_END=1432 /DNA_ORIENTATION=+